MLRFKSRRRASPALKPQGELTASERRVARLMVDAMDAVVAQVERDLTRIADAVAHSPAGKVADLVSVDPWYEVQEKLEEEFLAELLDAGSRVELPTLEKATLRYSFDRSRPESAAWARLRAAALVREITDEQRQTIRDVVAFGQESGLSPDDTARQMRQTVGLTQAQGGWVNNFRDRQVTANINAGMGVSDAVRAAQGPTARYQSQIHGYRSRTIARTEIMSANSQGRQQAWGQGIQQGFISPNALKEWIAEADACDICAPRNGTRQPVNKPWPGGEPPAHPNCRCDLLLIPNNVAPEAGRGLGGRIFATLSTFEDILAGVQVASALPAAIQQWRGWFEARRFESESERKTFGEVMESILEPEELEPADEPPLMISAELWSDYLGDVGDQGLDGILEDMFGDIYRNALASNPKLMDDFLARYTGTGRPAMDVSTTATLMDENTWWVSVSGDMYDLDTGGALFNIFQARRTIYLAENRVYHDSFVVSKEFQGYGTARHAHDALFDMYRAQGITEVTLEANIDVGGYTWARFGFDWKGRRVPIFTGDPDDQDEVQWHLDGIERDHYRIKDFIERSLDSVMADVGADPIDIDLYDEVWGQVQFMLENLSELPASGWPTPLEIAMLGYEPGASTWPGKRAMLRSLWQAVFYL